MKDTTSTNGKQGVPEWALQYAAMNWRVFPVWRAQNGVCCCPKGKTCKDPGKHPRTPHGHLAASSDPKKVGTWKWETANIGIATGPESGILVIDIDPRNGGLESIVQLAERLGKLPARPRVRTGGGGWHCYVRCPDIPIKKTLEVKGIEIKADGGYVVAPPSIHVTGTRYTWNPCPNGDGLAELPPKWLDFLRATEITSPSEEGEMLHSNTQQSTSKIHARSMQGPEQSSDGPIGKKTETENGLVSF